METADSFIYEAPIITLRYIPHSATCSRLDELGFIADDMLALKSALLKNMGLILVSGPTGSGKTTTLYAALTYIQDKTNQHIITVEHPVEVPLGGVTQLEVRDDISFTTLITSAIRHDPDVLMIGEIRDDESARVTLNAALSGLLALTTLHAGTALSSIGKMLNFGLNPYNLVYAARCAVTQRLFRKLCPNCRQPAKPDRLEESVIRGSGQELPETCFSQGEGCEHCNYIGYSGQVMLYELFMFDQEDQDKILHAKKKSRTWTRCVHCLLKNTKPKHLTSELLRPSEKETFQFSMRSVSSINKECSP